MTTQMKDKARQLIVQALSERLHAEPYPQPRGWAMQWDVDGLDYALRRNGHRPSVKVSDKDRALRRNR